MQKNRAVASFIPEPLEGRVLLSSNFPNVNISRLKGSQAEGAIVVDPTNPSRMFVATNIDKGDGILAAVSDDGGATWTHRTIADDVDSLIPACCDPSAAFDSFGNLFVSYINDDTNRVAIILSTDGGQTFSQLADFKGNVDQPTITAGAGSVWITFQKSNAIFAAGAAVVSLGSVGSFIRPVKVPNSGGGNFGDIAITASGQVLATWQKQTSGTQSKIYVSSNPGGLAAARFGKPVLVTLSHVPDFDYIPAMPDRGIDAEAGLEIDKSAGPFAGRVYLIYSDDNPAASGNTDTFLRYSDNGGSIWSNPIRINDDAGVNSQFLPRIKVDQSTGQVGVSWYDSRNDLGDSGEGNSNTTANDDAAYFATVVTPLTNGLLVSPGQQISAGISNAADAYAVDRINSIDLGDYTGLDFVNGILHPLWFDNSNSTADNPNGALKQVNPYTASVPASAFTAGAVAQLGGLADASGPVAALSFSTGNNLGSVKKGRTYNIAVTYFDAGGVNLATIGSANLLVTGPNSLSVNPQLLKMRTLKGGAVLATYQLTNPPGIWEAGDNGTYIIQLQPDQIENTAGGASTPGILGTFAVGVGLGKGSHSGGGSRGHGDPDAH